jgi:SHS2 domain-containing protein
VHGARPAASPRAARRRFEVAAGAAHDLDTLLFAFLDELLFCFLTDLFVCKELVVSRLARAPHWTLTASGRAGPPSATSSCTSCAAVRKQPCSGPTARAAVRAPRRGERFDRGRHVSGTEVKAITYSAMQIREAPGDAEVFVIVDI